MLAETSAEAGAGERSAAPRPKTATVERREASVPRHKRVHARLDALWDARRLASAWPAASCAGLTGASHAPERLSALRPPLDSGARSKVANPGRRNAPRERDGLFEIVRAIVAWIERSEIRGRWFPHFAALNAGYEATIACPGSATHHVAALVLRCARDTREESTCGCGKRSPAPIPCFRPVINNGWHNQNA